MYCRCIYIFFMYCMYLYICMYCRYLHVLHVTEYTEGITIYVYYRYICHCDLARVHLLQKACWVYSTLGVTTECIYSTFCTGSDYATCKVGWCLYVQHIYTCLSNIYIAGMIGNMFSIFLLSRKELKNSFNQETIPSRLKQIYRLSDRTYNGYMRRRDPLKGTEKEKWKIDKILNLNHVTRTITNGRAVYW